MPSSPAIVAAFDLDGTLTEGGSVVSWLRDIAGNRGVALAGLQRLIPLAMGALLSGTAADEAKESLFRALLQGRSVEEVTQQSRRYGEEHFATHERPLVSARLNWHLEQGHRVVLVSASPQIYVERIAEILGAHGAIGTRLASDSVGALTGNYLGNNCRGAEKLHRLREWMSDQGYDENIELYAYGNSRGDLRLLSSATHPYDVGKLGQLGALRKFPRLEINTR